MFRDPARGVCKRLVIEGDQLIGAVMYGDTADGNWFFGLIKNGTDITPMRETLIFGSAYQGGAQTDPMAAVAALPPGAEICGCNGVCKGKIVDAILGGANTLDLVRSATKASTSCGTCTGLVEQVMAVTLGDNFVLPTSQPMCKCTDHTHEDVRRLIKSLGLKSIPAVMQELSWKTVRGTALVDEVDPPQFGCIHVQLDRQHLDHAFDEIRSLGHPEGTAIRHPARRLVGIIPVHPQISDRDVVGTRAYAEETGGEIWSDRHRHRTRRGRRPDGTKGQ